MADNASGGSLVVKSLRAEDVEYVFTIYRVDFQLSWILAKNTVKIFFADSQHF
ncbi:MAG: hypothetical protein ACXAC6_03530 [Candidatus Hodarchaeales archaeon]